MFSLPEGGLSQLLFENLHENSDYQKWDMTLSIIVKHFSLLTRVGYSFLPSYLIHCENIKFRSEDISVNCASIPQVSIFDILLKLPR